MTANRAKFGINNFTTNASGASKVQPLIPVVDEPAVENDLNNVLDSNFINNVNNMGTVTHSPWPKGWPVWAVTTPPTPPTWWTAISASSSPW
jgi:hypothetical protein